MVDATLPEFLLLCDSHISFGQYYEQSIGRWIRSNYSNDFLVTDRSRRLVQHFRDFIANRSSGYTSEDGLKDLQTMGPPVGFAICGAVSLATRYKFQRLTVRLGDSVWDKRCTTSWHEEK
jgi:hypothetical protein